ncbi:homoserine kinase [Amycolatopsis acidiphila]|uniref:Homoserine kinase n=1 Tax=Amycolatopsis acidiphila TaxID=715473 RepID=A0A558A9X1_9PSEU|nr:homoserine kinase [Amycolatopsis acidiphila]TVT21052.1 homoserine kinase [Amycolatopsis acidiphila]UIJ61286.1 homoserine kinase [Amycolatopsis acidiphila]GHG78424.1 homoserine kinase [Amycolatopsis acidiphila]
MTSFKVTVPASSANLGPGFDALGLALGLHDVIEVQVIEAGLKVEVIDAGAGGVEDVPTDETHLVVRAIRRTCERLGVRPPGLHLRCFNRIPHARGLGSSAAAVVSGVAAGYALAEKPLDPDAVHLAAEFEGHADNAAASLLGGLVIAWCEDGRFFADRLRVHPSIRPVLAVPAVKSSTAATRGLLPTEVPYADAAFCAGRAALAVHALTCDPAVLLPATADRLHQHYRAPAYPATARLVRDLRNAGVAATVSGAGPTVLALTTDGIIPAGVGVEGFVVSELPVDSAGVQVTAG